MDGLIGCALLQDRKHRKLVYAPVLWEEACRKRWALDLLAWSMYASKVIQNAGLRLKLSALYCSCTGGVSSEQSQSMMKLPIRIGFWSSGVHLGYRSNKG
jgi:hypothetical protein